MDHMISHSQDPKNLACARGFLLLGGCAGCVWRVASGECFEKRFLLSLSPPSVHLSAETHRGLAACVQSTFPWRGYTDQLNMAEETHPLQHGEYTAERLTVCMLLLSMVYMWRECVVWRFRLAPKATDVAMVTRAAQVWRTFD